MAKAPVIRIPRSRVSEIELCAWVAQAAPGTVLEYHRGYLALDRSAFGRVADAPARAALGLLGAGGVGLCDDRPHPVEVTAHRRQSATTS